MKIEIDEKICLKNKLSPDELLIAIVVRNASNFEKLVNNLIDRGILTNSNGKFRLTQRWSDVVDNILTDSSKKKKADPARLKNLAEKMRDCFPEGKMPGTPYYYRCNNSEVMKKLDKFLLTHGDYSDEDIIDATRRFVSSFNGNYRYLPLIKYFISKFKDEEDEEGNIHKVEHYPLADYLENKESDNVVTNSDDWLVTIRN